MLPPPSRAVTRPAWWVALGALLVAPFAAAVLSSAVFTVGVLLAGRSPDPFSVDGIAYSYLAFALPFVPTGALLVLFLRVAPLGPLLSSAFGMVYGALTGGMGALILSYPEDYSWGTHIGHPLSVAIVMGLGLIGGVAAGLTFWQICRLGSRKQHG